MKNIIFIVLDGLGDAPVKELLNKTPLESSKTENFDYLAQNGALGILKPVFTTAIPTSEEGHFVLFGYNPKKYRIQRGLYSAKAVGHNLKKGEVALRGNFATVDDNLNIIDRRAGRIENTDILIKELNGIVIDGIKILVKKEAGHRVCVILQGQGLDSFVSDGDPHYSCLGKKAQRIIPLHKRAELTANVLNKFLIVAKEILKNHDINKGRSFPVNYILLREAASASKIPSFKKRYGLTACCIAGKFLYKEIGRTLGMKVIDVSGANGLGNTNLEGKVSAVLSNIKKYNFIYLHIKYTDTLAEDGNYIGKRDFIEKIDKAIKPLLSLKNVLISVSADHSTCCNLKRHCKEPIPLLIYGSNINDKSIKFSEKQCRSGGLGIVSQIDLMKKILTLAKKS